jgi:hypothetical protein
MRRVETEVVGLYITKDMPRRSGYRNSVNSGGCKISRIVEFGWSVQENQNSPALPDKSSDFSGQRPIKAMLDAG